MEDRMKIIMDPKLVEAVLSGDVSVLVATLDACRSKDDYSCLLSLRTQAPDDQSIGNILHLAAWNGREEFFREAIHLIPNQIVQRLLSHQEPSGKYPDFNPLHVAAYVGHLGIIKLIYGFYTNSLEASSIGISKPWLAKDANGSTPLHVALEKKKEECALEILSMDLESLCNMVDNSRNSPLFLAVRNGLSQVALQILMSGYSYSISGEGGFTPLHFAPNCSDEVCRRLMTLHSNLIKATDLDGRTILHQWVKMKGRVSQFDYLLNNEDDIGASSEIKRALVDLICVCDKHGDNIFHVAAKYKTFEVSKSLAKVYRNETTKLKASSEDREPWLIPNKNGQTPLELTLSKHDESYRWVKARLEDDDHYDSIEFVFLALYNGHSLVAQHIWNAQLRFGWITFYHRQQKIWQSALTYSDEVANWVVEKLPDLVSVENEVEEVLKEVSENGLDRAVKPMLKKFPHALKTNSMVWAKACENGHISTVLAFIDNCPYFIELCLQLHTTPLHHMNFNGVQLYTEFLEHPIVWRLRNFQDSNGETPLHRAIRCRNIGLADALLNDDDISRSFKDNQGRTPMDLLVVASRHSSEWRDMCKGIGIIPGLRITYLKDKNALFEVRSTQSLVATLVAAITFTAGFTLPGGFNNDTGEAIMVDKTSFLVFIFFDALALCCSTLTLVYLMWSMYEDVSTSWLLIDRSMPILLLALVSTLVAFMTGVYTVIKQKSPSAAIVILVMCSVFILSANRSIMKQFIKTTERIQPNPATGNSFVETKLHLNYVTWSLYLFAE